MVLMADYLHSVDMNKVFAHAYHLYKNGFQFWFDKEETVRVNKANERFVKSTPEEEFLLKHFEPADQNEIVRKTATEIAQHICEKEGISFNNYMPQNIGKLLIKHRFTCTLSKGIKRYAVKMVVDDMPAGSTEMDQSFFDRTKPSKDAGSEDV